MSAGSCQHLSLQTFALYFLFFKHMSVHAKEEKRWEDVLHLLFIPHVKLWIHTSYRLHWVNQNISDIFTSVLSKGLYWQFPKHRSPAWELSRVEKRGTCSIHLVCNEIFKNGGCSFLWVFPLDYSEVNTEALLMSSLSTAAAGEMGRKRSDARSHSKRICHMWS